MARKETENRQTGPVTQPAAARRVTAKVVLARCPTTRGLYGMRIEERDGDWVRTWAFKVDEARAQHEGFDREVTRGTMNPVDDYPGCPYCGSFPVAPCSCGKVFCAPDWKGQPMKMTCPWCGQTGEYHPTDKINVQGGGL